MENNKEEFKLIVENIPLSMDNGDLKEMFKPYGEVISSQVLKDEFSKRSLGKAEVVFEKHSSLKSAISELDGSDFQGLKLKLTEKDKK